MRLGMVSCHHYTVVDVDTADDDDGDIACADAGADHDDDVVDGAPGGTDAV